jgi:hypothetical protein
MGAYTKLIKDADDQLVVLQSKIDALMFWDLLSLRDLETTVDKILSKFESAMDTLKRERSSAEEKQDRTLALARLYSRAEALKSQIDRRKSPLIHAIERLFQTVRDCK